MSACTSISNSIPYFTEHARAPPLHVYPHDPAFIKYGLGSAPVTCNRTYWPPQSTHSRTWTPAARRHPSAPHSCSYHHRDHQSIHSPTCPWSATNRQPNGRPPANAVNCHCCFRFTTPYARRRYPHLCGPAPLNSARGCCRNDSGLCFRTTYEPVPTRKRLMTHQAHAFHLVDPSPWPLTGATAALLITSGTAI